MEKSSHNVFIWDTSVNIGYMCNLQKPAQSKPPPDGQKFAQSRVDVMMTIFCHFYTNSAKKMAFFFKNQCYV
jgi:hypothetical protein